MWLVTFIISLFAGPCANDLLRDLAVVESVNCYLEERSFPITYNFFMQGGYLNMPSARMAECGNVGIGYSWVHPYHNYNACVQPFSFLEVTGSYRVFRGVSDPVLSKFGYGDFSDKGANVKFSIIRPEDTEYCLPGVAVGADDFLGTCQFTSYYIVATQIFKKLNLEASLGYGRERIQGVFGGVAYTPFRTCCNCLIEGLTFTAEWDAIDYKHDPHERGRGQDSRVNYGIKWTYNDIMEFSVARVRGCKWAFGGSIHYNFGTTSGFVPKISNPKPFVYQTDTDDLCEALRCQGFKVYSMFWSGDNFHIHLFNMRWFFEADVRCRLQPVIAHLAPREANRVIVTLEGEGMGIQEYLYHGKLLEEYVHGDIGTNELMLLSPVRDVSNMCTAEPFSVCFKLLPKTQTVFGSSRGKFKSALGLNVGVEGYLWGRLYYDVMLGWIATSDLKQARGIDILNPSQLINVNTDAVYYYAKKDVTIDRAYLQRNWNFGCGFFGKFAVGHFNQQYGGAAAEFVWAPVQRSWALGFEGAVLGKRTLAGIGFNSRIRKLNGRIPTYRHFIGSQAFFNTYYDNELYQADVKVSVGKFLANDLGLRFEVGRYFDSGLRVYAWTTYTNGGDRINGSTYYDKGVGFTMPLDIFYTFSCRDMWEWNMAAWLRDVGYRASVGKDLIPLIFQERR